MPVQWEKKSVMLPGALHTFSSAFKRIIIYFLPLLPTIDCLNSSLKAIFHP